jgi:hypothetical protein
MTAEAPFAPVRRTRPFAVVSPGFEQVVAAPAGPGPRRHSGVSPVAPFAAVEVALDGNRLPVTAGLLTPEGDGVRVDLHPGRGRMSIVVVLGGRERVLQRRRVRGRPERMGFVLCENQVTGLVDCGSGWRAVVTERARVAEALDLREPATLARHSYAWGPVRDRRRAALGAVRAGPFGLTGVRDPHLVQHVDGTPYVRDGLLYLTMTCAGMGFFSQAHWGVFTLDLAEPERLTQVAHLYFRRDGSLLGDHAGQIVVDGDRARVLVSSWGDFSPATGVHVRAAACGLDVLAGVHVLDTVPFPMPSPHSTWDPAATVIDGRWYVAFVECTAFGDPFEFRPALAAGPPGGGWGEGLALVGSDTSLSQSEGPILARVDGRWRVLASDGHARRYVAYDLGMRPVGTLPAPYGTNIPHPQLVPLPVGSPLGTELMVTFDGTAWCDDVLGYGTHGDWVVMAR